MRSGVTYSVLLHVAVIAVGYFGLPSLRRPPVVETPVMVEVVTIADETKAAPPKPEPKKEPPKAEPKPPPEPPKAVAPPPPPPPPAPEPEPEVAAVPPPPQPKPEPKPKPKPEPEAKPKPKPEPKPEPKLARVKPKRKPKPPDQFTTLLKTVEELKKQPVPPKPSEEKKKKKTTKEAFEAQIALALAGPNRQQESSRKPTLSEIDALRNTIFRQLVRCWSIPAGAKDAQDLVVEIWVDRNQDGTVREARIKDQLRMATDPFFRAAAESALRAVLKPQCNPLKLPSDQYDVWRTMTLKFNPREMLGS